MDEPEVLLLKPLQVVPKLLVVAELTEDTPVIFVNGNSR